MCVCGVVCFSLQVKRRSALPGAFPTPVVSTDRIGAHQLRLPQISWLAADRIRKRQQAKKDDM